MKQAVELFPLVYTTSNEWEDQILSFIQRDELDVINEEKKSFDYHSFVFFI